MQVQVLPSIPCGTKVSVFVAVPQTRLILLIFTRADQASQVSLWEHPAVFWGQLLSLPLALDCSPPAQIDQAEKGLLFMQPIVQVGVSHIISFVSARSKGTETGCFCSCVLVFLSLFCHSHASAHGHYVYQTLSQPIACHSWYVSTCTQPRIENYFKKIYLV